MKLPSLRSHADVTTNTGFFCIRNISKTMQTSGKKHAEHCLAHVNKTAREIWSVFEKSSLLSKNPNALFPLKPSISSEMICLVLVFVGMDQQYVIPDNAYPCNKGDCLISNPNEEWLFSQE